MLLLKKSLVCHYRSLFTVFQVDKYWEIYKTKPKTISKAKQLRKWLLSLSLMVLWNNHFAMMAVGPLLMLLISCRFFCLLKLACLCSVSKTPLSPHRVLSYAYLNPASFLTAAEGHCWCTVSHEQKPFLPCLDYESFHRCRKLAHFNLSCTCWHFSRISALTWKGLPAEGKDSPDCF